MKHYLTARDCTTLIDAYFVHIKGKYYNHKGKKVYTREPESPTFTGLAAALGFNSLQEFEAYTVSGKHADIVKRAKLRIEIEYEKRLHLPAATAAVFVLKTVGWKEKPITETHEELPASLTIRVIESGPAPVGDEKEVTV